MKSFFYLGLLLWVSLTCLWRCGQSASDANKDSYLSDSSMIALGEDHFETYCINCHAFGGEISGPALGGVTLTASPQWVADFIADPQGLVATGDTRAVQVDKAYASVMPAFGFLEEKDIQAMVAYIHTFRETNAAKSMALPPGVDDPIPAKIPESDIVVVLDEVWQTPSSQEKRPLARINKLEPNPNGDLFLLDLNGKLYKIRDNKPQLYMDITEENAFFVRRPGLATGFGSFAFHPAFAQNGLLYTTHTERGSASQTDFVVPDSLRKLQWVLMEWKTSEPEKVPLDATSRELMRIDYPGTIHGVQNIAFNDKAVPGDPDYGLLYIGAGEGRAALSGYPELVEGVQSVWGALLRIDPQGSNSANGAYGIPEENPFVGVGGAVEEIYAHGFRNPHLFTWREDGTMILTNIGEKNLESIYVIEKGADYGWPRREGSLEIRWGDETSEVYPVTHGNDQYSYPAAEFDHDEAGAICGGYIYKGTMAELQGKYLFGSIVSGRLFFLDPYTLEPGGSTDIQEFKVRISGKEGTLRELLGKGRIDLRFGYDAQGDMYIMTKLDGRVYRMTGIVS